MTKEIILEQAALYICQKILNWSGFLGMLTIQSSNPKISFALSGFCSSIIDFISLSDK